MIRVEPISIQKISGVFTPTTMLAVAAIVATSVIARDKKKDGKVVKGATKDATVGAVPGDVEKVGEASDKKEEKQD